MKVFEIVKNFCEFCGDLIIEYSGSYLLYAGLYSLSVSYQFTTI